VIDRRPGHSKVWLFLCACLTLLILWLSLIPAVSAPSGLGWDKLNHAGAMALATGFTYLWLKTRRWAAAAAFFYGSFLGILIEILQATLTTSRSAEWGDVAADLIGAGCAWVVITIIQGRTA
jgi:hypothetical protein